MNDFALLQDAARAARASGRAACAATPPPPSAPARSKRAILAREAAERGVHLHLLPRGLARGRHNSSHARGRRGARALYWHVDVVFVQRAGRERRVHVDACAEGASVREILAGAADALRRRGRRRERGSRFGPAVTVAEEDDAMEVWILNEHVVGPAACEAGAGVAAVPGKALGEDDLHRYLPLAKTQTLAEVVRHRIIIEYPILYCAPRGSPEAQRLASAMVGVFEKPDPDSDEDESAESADESLTPSVSDDDADAALARAGNGARPNDGPPVPERSNDAEPRPYKRSRIETEAPSAEPAVPVAANAEA